MHACGFQDRRHKPLGHPSAWPRRPDSNRHYTFVHEPTLGKRASLQPRFWPTGNITIVGTGRCIRNLDRLAPPPFFAALFLVSATSGFKCRPSKGWLAGGGLEPPAYDSPGKGSRTTEQNPGVEPGYVLPYSHPHEYRPGPPTRPAPCLSLKVARDAEVACIG